MLFNSRLKTLLQILSYRRPEGSITEGQFIRAFVSNLPGVEQDAFRNWHVKIGDSPILWSCHTDTVHRETGRQTLHYDKSEQVIKLSRASQKNSSCLGADDGAGVFLMREMIFAGVPGHYIFHYGEEHGGKGSGALATNHAEWLKQFTFAIALDRAHTQDIVTHQFGSRTASDTFAASLGEALGRGHKAADGIYTDTAEYMDIIPECSNLSIGYEFAHTPREQLDVAYLFTLLDALIAMDQSALVAERDPSVQEYEHEYRFRQGSIFGAEVEWETFYKKTKDIAPEQDDLDIVDDVYLDSTYGDVLRQLRIDSRKVN